MAAKAQPASLSYAVASWPASVLRARPTELENILITLAEDSSIWIAGRLIDPRAVRPNIERLHAENPAAAVIIRAHKRSSNKTFVAVMDASRQAGIYGVSLAAD